MIRFSIIGIFKLSLPQETSILLNLTSTLTKQAQSLIRNYRRFSIDTDIIPYKTISKRLMDTSPSFILYRAAIKFSPK